MVEAALLSIPIPLWDNVHLIRAKVMQPHVTEENKMSLKVDCKIS